MSMAAGGDVRKTVMYSAAYKAGGNRSSEGYGENGGSGGERNSPPDRPRVQGSCWLAQSLRSGWSPWMFAKCRSVVTLPGLGRCLQKQSHRGAPSHIGWLRLAFCGARPQDPLTGPHRARVAPVSFRRRRLFFFVSSTPVFVLSLGV